MRATERTFTLFVNFCAKGNDKDKQPPLKKRASGVFFASRHTEKKREDSSDVRLAEKPKQKKKKTSAQAARDRTRRKTYCKNTKVARKLRTPLYTESCCRKQGRKPARRFLWSVSQRILVAWNGHPQFPSLTDI